ncbi:type VI secretion system tube protein TssD [Belliella marina]|uniref:Type VI secretion system tube protein TssD n=1 Tax=Belliella marina TaxID=1644146 RepID=A0ABW4VVK5_9BACT
MKTIKMIACLIFALAAQSAWAQQEINMKIMLRLQDEKGNNKLEYELNHFNYYFTTATATSDSIKSEKEVIISASLFSLADGKFLAWVAQDPDILNGEITVTDLEKRNVVKTLAFKKAQIQNIDESYMKGVNYRNSTNFVFKVKELTIDKQVLIE